FAYFGPAWLINFCMSCDQEGSVGIDGGWGACVGPQSFFWGGTWICGATGTDNPTLVADIMKTMTCNADVMKEIVIQDDDFANNKKAMAEMASSDYTSKVLGGQNPLPMYMEGAEKIDLSNLSAYDQGCNESFQNAMKDYFLGNATYEEALDNFYKSVIEKYPELTQ
ncbi:MAG: carbohydrate ABC transporter substrate-binding protein, partial [Lachnospiraceae bacterium]|nr:carbohydrate ABC transporter substrate-binding protein [Lachnospiraceae bacterium]